MKFRFEEEVSDDVKVFQGIRDALGEKCGDQELDTRVIEGTSEKNVDDVGDVENRSEVAEASEVGDDVRGNSPELEEFSDVSGFDMLGIGSDVDVGGLKMIVLAGTRVRVVKLRVSEWEVNKGPSETVGTSNGSKLVIVVIDGRDKVVNVIGRDVGMEPNGVCLLIIELLGLAVLCAEGPREGSD